VNDSAGRSVARFESMDLDRLLDEFGDHVDADGRLVVESSLPRPEWLAGDETERRWRAFLRRHRQELHDVICPEVEALRLAGELERTERLVGLAEKVLLVLGLQQGNGLLSLAITVIALRFGVDLLCAPSTDGS
jgi:hypothetical protein